MKVLCISGHAGSGKGTVALMLQKILEARENQVLILNYGDFVKLVASGGFHWNGLKDQQGRAILQKVGTDIGRAVNPDVWIDCMLSILTTMQSVFDYVLIADVRFENEISRLKEAGLDVKHLRVLRDECSGDMTDMQRKHVSEIALDYAIADYYINNSGSMYDLNDKVANFVEDIEWMGGMPDGNH